MVGNTFIQVLSSFFYCRAGESDQGIEEIIKSDNDKSTDIVLLLKLSCLQIENIANSSKHTVGLGIKTY
jgi:hypothetical protein